ncbi:hypothetical protein [Actinopolymorpha singaporensis]|nr:hypothetical protein [Actinopolymorpha singaporensis]
MYRTQKIAEDLRDRATGIRTLAEQLRARVAEQRFQAARNCAGGRNISFLRERAAADRDRAEVDRALKTQFRHLAAQAHSQLVGLGSLDPIERERAADERDCNADERDQAADERDRIADQREADADDRDRDADEREQLANDRERLTDRRDQAADERDQAADDRDSAADHNGADT